MHRAESLTTKPRWECTNQAEPCYLPQPQPWPRPQRSALGANPGEAGLYAFVLCHHSAPCMEGHALRTAFSRRTQQNTRTGLGTWDIHAFCLAFHICKLISSQESMPIVQLA